MQLQTTLATCLLHNLARSVQSNCASHLAWQLHIVQSRGLYTPGRHWQVGRGSRSLSPSAMSFGRIHCILFTTRGGEVIYERFYDRLSEVEKGEIRAAFALAASNSRLTVEDQDHVGIYKTARFCFIPFADIIIFLLGSGEYDELAGSGIIRTVYSILQDVLDKTPTASLLLDKYMKLCVIIDEIINEGILESTDRDAIRKALKNKAAWE